MHYKQLLFGDNSFRAHSRDYEGNTHYESLQDHLDLTVKYYEKICNDKGLGEVFDRIYGELFGSDLFKSLYDEMIIATVYLHDLGKINPAFQTKKMKNTSIEEDYSFQDSHHSSYGSWIYMREYLGRVYSFLEENDSDISDDEYSAIGNLLISNISIINCHHSKLKSRAEAFESIYSCEKAYETIDYFYKHIDMESGSLISMLKELEYSFSKFSTDRKSKAVYVYTRLLFGLLTQADILATMEYTEGIKTEDLGLIKDREVFAEVFEDNSIVKSIREYENGQKTFSSNDINELRTKMFLETEKNLDTNKNIYMLEAPTGAGKTLMSFNLALKLLKSDMNTNKIVYAFPFNTLVEQTNAGIRDIFREDEDLLSQIAVYNSVSSFENLGEIIKSPAAKTEEKAEEQAEEDAYSLLYRDYQFLYYPITITTNIKLFDILFGNEKSSFYPLPLIANSVIILDEIQSYKNSIWHEMIEMLAFHAEILNIKIIIMSATLPDVKRLIEDDKAKEFTKSLIQSPQVYYSDPRFKDRVIPDFSLMDIVGSDSDEKKNNIFNTIAGIMESRIDKNEMILIEFIKKSTAIEFFNEIVERFSSREVVINLLTGDTSRAKRKAIIKEIKEKRALGADRCGHILVATQTIEAGVDIDMDIGFKDISLLDSEEQFLGRINRNFRLGGGRVYFFDLDDVNAIYKNDVRNAKSLSLLNDEIRDILARKDFNEYYNRVLNQLKLSNKKSPDHRGHKYYGDRLNSCDYPALAEHFRLIEETEKDSVYLVTDANRSEAEDCWNRFKELLKSKLDFPERKIKLLKLRTEMDEYIYEVFTNRSKSVQGYSEYCGGIYYYDRADDFFENGEFNSKNMNKDSSYDIM